MPSQKRRHADSDSEGPVSEDELDISSALTAPRPRTLSTVQDHSDSSDGELNEIIQKSIVDRNVKGGTELLKKAKGKAKMIKGEVGGGSFQSMGTLLR